MSGGAQSTVKLDVLVFCTLLPSAQTVLLSSSSFKQFRYSPFVLN